MRFIDPKGEAIELLGDEMQRKQLLGALREGVGPQAGAYLYENKVTTKDKDGSTVTRYFVGIYTNGPDGKGPAFQKANLPSASLAGVIRSGNVVAMSFVPNGTLITDDSGDRVKIGSIMDLRTPGATSVVNGQLSVFLLDPSTDPGQIPPRLMKPSVPGKVDLGILSLHELGHAGYRMGALLYETNRQSALDLENMVRQTRDPNAPVRVEH